MKVYPDKGGIKIYRPTPGAARWGAKSFWEEKNDGANTFSEEKNDGTDNFLGKENGGARTFLQKKKTFFGMNSYNSHKIYRKNTSAGLLFRIIKWGAKTFFGEKNDGA